MEKLNCENIFEIERIKVILQHTEPSLLKIFDYIIELANQKINEEREIINLELEDNVEPVLSDHDSDD